MKQSIVALSHKFLEIVKKNPYLVAVGMLFVVGFLFRIFYLSNQSFWIDEGFTIMQTRAISSYGIPLLDSGNVEIKDSLFPYLAIFITKIFGETEFTYRIVSVFIGSGSILLAYLVGKNIFSKQVGLIFSFMVTFSYWHIVWSRQARGYALLAFFVLAFILAIFKYSQTRRDQYIFLAVVFLLAASFSKSAGLLLAFPFLTYLVYNRKYRFVLLITLLFVVTGFFLRHMFINNLGVSFSNYFLEYFVGYYWDYFGLILPLSLAGMLLAARYGKFREIHLFNIAIFFTILMFFSFFVYINQKRYLFYSTPLLFLYAAYAVSIPFNLIRGKSWKFYFVSFLLIVDGLTVQSIVFMPPKKSILEKYTPQPNFREAYGEIKNKMSSDDCIISAYPFMDRIYLGRSDYAIPISYTGRIEDSTAPTVEYYSGVVKIQGDDELDAADKIMEIRSKSDVFIVLDKMALARMDPDLREYIIDNYSSIFRSGDSLSNKVIVYELGKY